MATVRLTQTIKEDIACAILDHKFPRRRSYNDDKKKLMLELAEDIWNDQLDASQRKLLASLPIGWCSNYGSLSVVFGGEYHTFYWPQQRRTPEHLSKRISYDGRHEFTSRFRKIDNDFKDKEKEINEARAKIYGAMAAFSTLKQLVEAWPEIESFAEKYKNKEGEIVSRLPVVQVSEMNKMFNLPPKRAGAKQ